MSDKPVLTMPACIKHEAKGKGHKWWCRRCSDTAEREYKKLAFVMWLKSTARTPPDPEHRDPKGNPDPRGSDYWECVHNWQPVSFRFETQMLDQLGRVEIRQPDCDKGRVYCVCLRCATHTYMTTAFHYRLYGTEDMNSLGQWVNEEGGLYNEEEDHEKPRKKLYLDEVVQLVEGVRNGNYSDTMTAGLEEHRRACDMMLEELRVRTNAAPRESAWEAK